MYVTEMFGTILVTKPAILPLERGCWASIATPLRILISLLKPIEDDSQS